MGGHGSDSDHDEPLKDHTIVLPIHSKRTERKQRQQVKSSKKYHASQDLPNPSASLAALPSELIIELMKYIAPSDLFTLRLVSRRFCSCVDSHGDVIATEIIDCRYPILAQCFPIPKLLSQVDPEIQPYLLEPVRQKQLSIHHKPYQHIQAPDPHLLCTCLTCMLTWNNLGLAVDFASWQAHLDNREPIPMVPRGRDTDWNRDKVSRNAEIVRRALTSSLWHAWILERHLNSTIRSIRRHRDNKGDKRRHVEMSEEDADRGTDEFLEKPGPLSLEFPFHRDEYYMLEAYLPNRWFHNAQKRWIFRTAGHHERDVNYIASLARR